MTKRRNTVTMRAGLVSLAVATVLSLASPVRSQIGLFPRLDLETAVNKAIESNPITKSADSRVRIAEANVREQAAGKQPSFSFSQSVVRSNNPVFVFGSLLEQKRFGPSNFAIDSLNNPNGLFNFRTQVNGQISLFDQRQTSSRVSLAEIRKHQSVLMAEAARQQLRFDVIKTYFGVMLERKLVTVAVDAMKTAEANKKKTQDMVDVGMTNDADRLAAEVELANAVQRKVEADGQLITTLASLNLTIGEKPDLDHELTGELRERFFPIEDQAELIRIALENRPDYQRASLEIESSRQKKKSVRNQRLPRVDAFGNFGYSSPYIANGSTDYTVGVNLSYTVFDPGRKARTEQAVETEVLAELERDNLANQLRLDVIRSLQAFRTSEAKIRVSIKSIAQAEEALRIIDDRYKFGLTTITEVLRGNSALVRAKQDLMTTRYEYYVNFARLLLATGRLNDVRWFD